MVLNHEVLIPHEVRARDQTVTATPICDVENVRAGVYGAYLFIYGLAPAVRRR